MSFQVFTGAGGLAGWALLGRAQDRQRELVANDASVKVASDYFRDNIASVQTAEDLISDYRLLNVALRAFGLEGDIANKAFIRQVLESDLSDDRSLANRLSDKSYLRLAEAFGFGEAQREAAPALSSRLIAQYVEREFEARVGENDQNLRLALNARREIGELAARASSNNTKWYEVLGNQPLRKVFEGAFGFGSEYVKLPIDRQLEEFVSAADRMFGSGDMEKFSDSENVEKLIRNFLARSAVNVMPASNRYSVALMLLTGRG